MPRAYTAVYALTLHTGAAQRACRAHPPPHTRPRTPRYTAQRPTALSMLDTVRQRRSRAPDTLTTDFQDAQASAAAHRKLANSLRRIHAHHAADGRAAEDRFAAEFVWCIAKTLSVRDDAADRVLRFCAHYMHLIHSAAEAFAVPLALRVLGDVLPGLDARDRCVRLRACQVVTATLNSIDEIEDEVYERVRKALVRRLRDREAGVRIEAVVGAARLQNGEEGVGEDRVKRTFVELIQHDPNAAVRRAVMLNLEKNEETLPFVIERARDTDSVNRRTVFSRTLGEMGDFRRLSIGKREKILGWGLRDRDEEVRRAAVKMLCTVWMEHVDHNLLEVWGGAGSVLTEKAGRETGRGKQWDCRGGGGRVLWGEERCGGGHGVWGIAKGVFSEDLVGYMVGVFRKVVSEEGAFVKLLVEIVVGLLDGLSEETGRDGEWGEEARSDDSFVSAASNEDAGAFGSIDSVVRGEMEGPAGARKTLVVFRCLHLTQAMLENVEKSLRNNVEFMEIHSNLIVPAVRSHNGSIREKGLRCLGLYSLLDKKSARENLVLFCHCVVKGHDSLQVEALKIVTDIFMRYKYEVFDGTSVNVQSIQSLFEQILQNSSNVDLVTVAVEAVSKLMLTSFFDDPKLLGILIILYFHPKTSSNLDLRQILAYFIPVYCYSLPKNQFRLQEVSRFCFFIVNNIKIFVSTLHKLLKVFDDLDSDVEPIPFSQIALQMMDWIDPKKLINPDMHKNQPGDIKANKDIHLYLAKDICIQINKSYNKEERRTLCSLLNKLHITSTSDHELADSLQKTIFKLLEENNTLDSFTKNSLNKFSSTLCKFVDFKGTNYTAIEAAE
ncbi:hypothetical protein PMAC_001077 [Pneumocystis sp. 'macacae']|nr:hypothetical protein PMAC_001077 [Pneumocystis sp. 'macacae']